MIAIRLTVLLALLVTVSSVIAKPSEKDSTASSTKSSEKENQRLKFSGYFDTYYTVNFNQPANNSNLGNSEVARGFDRYAGQFQLGMFLNQLAYAHDNIEFLGEVGFGPNIQYASYGSDFRYKWGTVVANNSYTAVFIKQAYVKVKASEKLSFTLGQFGTHIGYEFIDAPLNFHYSISNTFNAGIPFYHVGLKAGYVVNEKISLMGGLVNGTDNINNNNHQLKFIGQLLVTPREGVEISINTIQGNEANSRKNGRDTASYFGVVDLVANYQVTSRVKIGVWAMYGSQQGEFQGGQYFQEMRHWSGVNFYTQCKITNHFTVGSRFEHFDNSAGVRALLTNGKGTYVDSFTITGNIQLSDGSLTLKPELRFDSFEKMKSQSGEVPIQQFADANGNFTSNSQTTLGIAAVFKF